MSQGQSVSTIDKERRIGAAISVSARIADRVFGHNQNYRFWYFDANAGSGWNEEVGVPGSPIVFWDAARRCLPRLRPEPFFCDISGVAIAALQNRLGDDLASSYLIKGDNEEAIEVFCERICRSGENPRYAIGAVLADPNGYYYRNERGEGPPIAGLEKLAAEFPRLDLIVNLNTRTYRMQRAHKHTVQPPSDVLGRLNRQHWLVALAGGQSRHLLAVGRNMRVEDHRAVGFYHLDSAMGDKIINAVCTSKQAEDAIPELPGLFGSPGLSGSAGGGDEKG